MMKCSISSLTVFPISLHQDIDTKHRETLNSNTIIKSNVT